MIEEGKEKVPVANKSGATFFDEQVI